MNRGLLIVLAPALLVALVYLGLGIRPRVSLPFGMVLLGVAAVVLLARRARSKRQKERGEHV